MLPIATDSKQATRKSESGLHCQPPKRYDTECSIPSHLEDPEKPSSKKLLKLARNLHELQTHLGTEHYLAGVGDI